MNAQGTDKMGTIIIKMFIEVGLQLEIGTNLKNIDFLDLTFNLIIDLYTPHEKPKDSLLCILRSHTLNI